MWRQRGQGESRFRGVSRKPGTERWRAQIQLNLGTYDTEDEAATMYARAELALRGQALYLRRTHGDLRGKSPEADGSLPPGA